MRIFFCSNSISAYYRRHFHAVGTSTKAAERLERRAEKSCQFICANTRHAGSPFVLHPVLSAISVPFRDLQRLIGQY